MFSCCTFNLLLHYMKHITLLMFRLRTYDFKTYIYEDGFYMLRTFSINISNSSCWTSFKTWYKTFKKDLRYCSSIKWISSYPHQKENKFRNYQKFGRLCYYHNGTTFLQIFLFESSLQTLSLNITSNLKTSWALTIFWNISY